MATKEHQSRKIQDKVRRFVRESREHLNEYNPWHNPESGKFSSSERLAKKGEGSYSKDGKKYQVGPGKYGPSMKKVGSRCGRGARPTPARRCSDERIPAWVKRRYDKEKYQ